MQFKKPQSKKELQMLLIDHNIQLGEIDTSLIVDMSYLFQNSIRKNEQFFGIELWDVSNVENMEGMFWRAQNFNQPLDSWSVNNVENMQNMFCLAISFNQTLRSWNVGKVKNMRGMFHYAFEFNQPLNSWDVSNVKNTCGMFRGAKSFQISKNWNHKSLQPVDFAEF